MTVAVTQRAGSEGVPGASPGKHRRGVSLKLRLTLVAASLLAPLLMLELALRLFGPILPGNYSTGYYLTTHPVYGRFHVTSFGGWTRAPEYTTYLRTNSLGLRGPEISASKPSDVFRVLVVGDSFVEAAQVAEDETFVHRLAASLEGQVAGKRIEVLNAGIGGWGTGQEMLYLEQEGLKLQPDLVLLVLYDGNDLANNSPRLERQDVLEIAYKPYWELDGQGGLRELPFRQREPDPSDRWLWPLRRASVLFNFAESGFFDKFKYRDLDIVGNQSDVGKPVLLADYPPDWEEAWQVTELLLDRAAKDVTASGGTFAVVLAPSTFQVVNEDWRDLVKNGRRPQSAWDRERPNKVLAEIAARRGFRLIDLMPALRDADDDGSSLYFDRDKHWTARGHEVVAAELSRQLRSKGLVATRSGG
jgi:hypothetical protein